LLTFIKRWIGFGALISLIIAMNWLLPSLVKPTPHNAPGENLIDEYMLGAKAIRYDDNGQIAEKLFVASINHVQNQDYMTLEAPKLIMNRDNLTWVVQAQSGKSFNPQDNPFAKIELDNNVEIHMLQQPPQAWVLKTEKLTLLPREEKAVTDEHVTIHSNQLTIEGQGMHGDLKQGQIDLNHQVKTTYGTT
jgi:lipopolysaccharide export system protein LptC